MEEEQQSKREEEDGGGEQESVPVPAKAKSRQDGDDENDDNEEDTESRKLAWVAKEFVQLIQVSADFQLDLNQAATTLKASKGQIDDVTNILEGVGYIEKVSTDMVKLVQADNRSERVEERQILQSRLDQVLGEEATLDDWISQLQDKGYKPNEKEAHLHTPQKPTPQRPSSQYITPPSAAASTRYTFGRSSPFKKEYTLSDRLVQVSSEDTAETLPSAKSFASYETLNIQSPATTTTNPNIKSAFLPPKDIGTTKKRRVDGTGEVDVIYADEKASDDQTKGK